jgi:hypothetical protein
MIASWILLFALQVTPELQRHIESGLRANRSIEDLPEGAGLRKYNHFEMSSR